jgi:hypothetical protein
MGSLRFKENIIFTISLISITLLAIILRHHNLNFDDLWGDEIFSFWISNPEITIKESLIRAFSSGLNFFFDLALKFFHLFFGYDVYVSRYFSFIVGIISFLFFVYLLLKITNKKSVIFGSYILCINLYHLKYTQELRSYILTFLLALFFILLNFKKTNSIKKFNLIRYIASIFTVLIMYCNHAFTILIVGSFIVFSILEIFKTKQIFKYQIIIITSYVIVTIIFLIFYYFTNLSFINPETLNGISPNWMKQPKLSFYTNFYFSEFFGSRILGLIHLIILIFCVIYFRSILFFKSINIYTFFVILIFCSYLIPLILGYIFGPILLGRYLIFLLIPIICLLCHHVIKLDNKIIRYTFIILITLITTINHVLYENTFRFYAEPYSTKPQLKKSLQIINESDVKVFSISKLEKNFNHVNDVYENYVIKYIEKNKYKINYYDYKKNKLEIDRIWLINFEDITNLDFEKPTKIGVGYKTEDTIKLNRLTLILLTKLK